MDLVINIGTHGDASGVEKLDESIQHSIEDAKELGKVLKLGLGIDVAGKLVEAVAEIPKILKEATQEGVAFNQFLQDSTIAVAGALRSADPTKYINFNEAKAQAGDAIETIQAKANQLGLDFHSMVESFSINLPTMAKAGITELKDQIDTITLLLSVARQKGIDGMQAQRDIIDLLNGQGNRTILGKELESNGITTEAIAKAKEMGTLAELFRSGLGGFAEGMQAASHTYSAEMQRFYNEIDQVLGKASVPVFDGLKAGVQELNAELSKPETSTALKALGYDIEALVQDGVALTEWAVKNAGDLAIVAHSAGLVAIAFAAIKIKDIVVGLTAMSLGLEKSAGSLAKETVELEANTEATAANTAEKARFFSFGRGSAGQTLGGLGAAAGTGVGLGTIANVAMSAYADDLNQKSSASQALGEDVGSIANQRTAQFRAVASPQDRDKLYAGLQEDVKNLAARLGSLDPSDADGNKMVNAALSSINDLMDRTATLSGEKLKQLAAEKEITAEQAKQKALQAEGVANTAALADADVKRAAAEKLESLRESMDPTAIAKTIADKQADFDKARQDFTHPADTSYDPKNKVQKHTAEEINQMGEQLDALKKLLVQATNSAKDDAKTKQAESDKEAIAALQDKRDLVEATGKLRLEGLDSIVGKEAEVGKKRKEIEDEIATKKLEIENQIGKIQKETDDERNARATDYQTGVLNRQNELDKTIREAAKKKAEDLWKDGAPRSGGIDGRTVRSYDIDGTLASSKGVLQPGYTRDRLGVVSGPDNFGGMTGPGWGGENYRTPADLAQMLPPAARSAPGKTDTPTTPAESLSGATSAAKQLADEVPKLIDQLKSATDRLQSATSEAKAVDAAAKELGSALRQLAATVHDDAHRLDNNR